MLSNVLFEDRVVWPIILLQGCIGSLFALTIYLIVVTTYNILFHPLHGVPGPKFAAASRIPYVYHMVTGSLAYWLKELHDDYGPVVRTAPNELSFTESSAWKVIYGHHSFQKNYDMFYTRIPYRAHSLLVADNADHTRMRRVLAPAFSEKALKEQEPVIQSYVDLLINRLHEQETRKYDGGVNIVQWYNWTTFDIVADLALGETFNCLGNTTYRHWASLIYHAFKSFVFINATKNFPPLDSILHSLVPKSLIKKQLENFRIIMDKVDRRIALDTGRPDFMSQILRHNDEKGLTRAEMHSNGSLLITAGNETSATLLAGMTYLLLKTPRALRKLTNELRETFRNESEISLESINGYEYLSAAIQESLRLFPPIPEGLPRVTPREGAEICGHWVPGGTFVQISPFAANHSATNFTQPDAFIPERWLDPSFNSDNKSVFQPFSSGPRNCIGRNLAMAELRLIMAKMLWNFDMELCEDCDGWIKQRTFILWEKEPLMVKLNPVIRAKCP